MELLNMFSDLAPISNNGYREQLYTDPGILQGVEFIQNENKVKREVEQSLDLNLISDSRGTESATVHSAGVLDVEEGFQESMGTSGQEQTMSQYSEELKIQYGIALAKFNALIEEAKNPGKGVIPLPEPVAPAVETPEQKEKRLADDKLAREKLKKILNIFHCKWQILPHNLCRKSSITQVENFHPTIECRKKLTEHNNAL